MRSVHSYLQCVCKLGQCMPALAVNMCLFVFANLLPREWRVPKGPYDFANHDSGMDQFCNHCQSNPSIVMLIIVYLLKIVFFVFKWLLRHLNVHLKLFRVFVLLLFYKNCRPFELLPFPWFSAILVY